MMCCIPQAYICTKSLYRGTFHVYMYVYVSNEYVKSYKYDVLVRVVAANISLQMHSESISNFHRR